MFWVLGLYIYQRVGFLLLLSPFIAPVWPPDVEFWLFSPQISRKKIRITGVSWNRFDGFVTRTLFLVPPVFRGCGSVPGSWAPRCCRHNFIVVVLEYPSFADIENLFYAVVGEITSTPPSTGAGVREYCHNSYNGCFSKVEVNDFRRFLGYVLKDGYSWM